MSASARQPGFQPRKRPVQSRSTVTVDAMLEAAARILLTDGYRRLTTARVARLAGVSVGSLYQYFPNRQSLVAEVIRRKVEASLRSLETAASDARGPLPEALASVMAAFAEEKRSGLALAFALREPLAELEGREAMAAGARRAEAILAALIVRLGPGPLAGPERAHLSLAVAALEGAVTAAAERDPAIFAGPDFGATLARILLAALDMPGSTSATHPPTPVS